MRSIYLAVLALALTLLHAAPVLAQTRGVTGSASGATGVRPGTRPPSLGSALGGGRATATRLLPATGTARGRLIAPTHRPVFDPFLRARPRVFLSAPGVLVVLPVPVVRHYGVTTHYVHTVVEPAPARAAPVVIETCALVTVLQPGERGYWKELTLPVAGARNLDELQRVLAARVEEGEAFVVRDAGGETLAIPSPADLDRLFVQACRP